MGNALADNAYRNINAIVENIHERIYKGNRDRNRYQLTHGIYVWWEAGKVIKMFDCVEHKSLDLTDPDTKTQDNVDGMGNMGFYYDARPILISAVKCTLDPQTIAAYESINDLERVVRSNLQNLFSMLA